MDKNKAEEISEIVREINGIDKLLLFINRFYENEFELYCRGNKIWLNTDYIRLFKLHLESEKEALENNLKLL